MSLQSMDDSAHKAGDPSRHSGSITRNAIFQIATRLFVSGARLAVAIVVIRFTGVESYGEYSLILSFLFIAEWLVDFGVIDIGVREASRDTGRMQVLLTAITIIAVCQAVLAFVLMSGAFYALGYDESLVRAGLIGGSSLLFFASVVVFRIQFRTQMTFHCDFLGEVVGSIVLIALVSVVGLRNGSIEELMACYLISRVAHAATVLILSRRSFRVDVKGADLPVIRNIVAQAIPLGIAGLLFALNDNMIPIMLSKFTSLDAVAEFQYALRFVLPIVMIVQSLNVAFFPILSRSWGSETSVFEFTLQNALEASVVVGGALFCFVNGGAEFFLGFAGDHFVQSGLVFRLLSCIVLLQVITLPITPLIVISGGVHKVLWLSASLVAAQFLALLWLIPLYGTLGAVSAYLGVKLIVGTVPIIVIGQRLAGVRLAWWRPIKAIASALAAIVVSELTLGLGSVWAAMLSVTFYAALLFVFGVINVSRIRTIVASLSRSGGVGREPV